MPCSNTGQFCYKELVSMPKRKKTESKKSTSNLTPKQREYDKEYKALVNKLKRKAKDVNKRGYTIPEDLIPEKPKKRLAKYLQELQERVKNIYDYVYYVSSETGEYISGFKRRGQERREAAQKGVEKRRQNDSIRQMEQFQRDFKAFYEANREAIENGEYLRSPLDEPTPFPEPKRKPVERPYYDESTRPEIPQPLPPETITRPQTREPTAEDLATLPQEVDKILNTVYAEIERWQPEPRWSSELAELKREDVNKLGSIIDGAIRELGKDRVAWNLANCVHEFESICIEIMYMSGSKYHDTGREGIRSKLVAITQMVQGRPLTLKESMEITGQSESFNESE